MRKRGKLPSLNRLPPLLDKCSRRSRLMNMSEPVITRRTIPVRPLSTDPCERSVYFALGEYLFESKKPKGVTMQYQLSFG